MATDVLAIYNTRSDADAAAQALTQAGFSRSDIQVEDYNGQSYNPGSAGQSTESGWDRLLDKLRLHAPQHEANYYAQGLTSGQSLVSVTTQTDDDADRAADILDRCNAVNIDENVSQYAQTSGYQSNYQTNTASANYQANTAGTVNAGDNTVIPVVEEELAVGKRQVQRGGVRVYQHVTERPVEEQVILHDETVTVDRRPVSRAATAADFQNQDFTVTETSEEAVVAKNARVVEEVVVGKTAHDRTETVRDTVRRTDVDVQNIDQTLDRRTDLDVDADDTLADDATDTLTGRETLR